MVAQQFSGVFRGDAEGMLSALIEASKLPICTEQEALQTRGRELVPWVDDSISNCAELEPLEARGSRGSSKGQQASYAKFPAPVSHKHARAARMLDSPQHKKGQSKRSKAGSPARSASPRTSSDACACPALAASPKPENLPMPTTGLLSRALVRSRSPSPPKDAAVASLLACYQVQQLVRPVAA